MAKKKECFNMNKAYLGIGNQIVKLSFKAV